MDQPDLALNPDNGFPIGGWYWTIRSGANSAMGEQPRADLQDFRQASSMVNSGRADGPINSWGVRLGFYERALRQLNIAVSPELQRNIDRGIELHSDRDNHRLPAGRNVYE